MTNMNRVLKTLLAGCALTGIVLLAGGAALAAPDGACGPGGGAPWAAMMRGDFKAHAEKRLTALHDGLKLRQEQEAGWGEFRGVLLGQAEKMQTKVKEWRDAAEGSTALDRIERMQKGADERRAALDTFANATRQFYGTLDAEQKAYFDQHFRMMPGEGRGPRHRRPA